jgi:hypothetical protein
MLLGRPWLKDAKVTHDWGNNVIIVHGNGIARTILVNKKLGTKTKKPQVFIFYDLLEGLTNEEEDLIFEIEPKLFLIGTITIPKEIVSLLCIGMLEIKINEKSKPQQRTSNQGAIEWHFR